MFSTILRSDVNTSFHIAPSVLTFLFDTPLVNAFAWLNRRVYAKFGLQRRSQPAY